MKNSINAAGRMARRSWKAAALAAMLFPLSATAHDEKPAHHTMLPFQATSVMKAQWLQKLVKQNLTSASGTVSAAAADCVGGFANPGTGDPSYPCEGIDMQSFLSLDDIGGTSTNSEANDIWGWTADDGSEYAIVGRVFGTSFVDISDPRNPVYLGNLPTHGAFGSSWRDVKVYQNHAYVVSEAQGHGMQIFDLTQLETMSRANLPVTFAETGYYRKAASSHNIAINEDSGFAYMVGNGGKNSCSGGLHMINLSNLTNPSFAGCYSGDGYTHDVQCVNYTGPDADYAGREICFASNEDTVTIVDVTNKASPTLISRTPYPGASYTHQGWLSPDHTFFVLDDELDEYNGVVGNTTTRVLDVFDLDAPSLSLFGTSNPNYNGAGVYTSDNTSIDHNLYMVGGCAVQANYRSGLRIVDLRDAIDSTGAVGEIASFDIWPPDDAPQFNGMWSNYAYFPSGNIIASGIEQGLYVLKPQFDLATACDTGVVGNAAPVVTISAPGDGSSFADGDTIAFAASATDAEDGTAPIGDWTSSLDGVIGNGGSFSTAALSVGTHSISAAATDSGGATGAAAITVIVTAVGGGTDMAVFALTGSVLSVSNKRYTGEVLVEIRAVGGAGASGATVSGAWSGAAKGGGSCVTGAVGTCSVSKAGKLGQDLTFTVTGVTHATLTYAPGSNVETAETIPTP